ncbi:MAG: hypothetical protein V1755_09290 [Chloroflexota bacterium]
MTDTRKSASQLVGAPAAALVLVTVIDLFTNSIDMQRFSWDFRYYIAIAEHGFAGPAASPFAYRYLTPMLARGASLVLQLPIEGGFAALAYFGSAAQLLAVFLFTRWYTRSARGAWVAALITGFSLFHVKFLLFDTFRPDRLAYPPILLQAYFALTGKSVRRNWASVLRIAESAAFLAVGMPCRRLLAPAISHTALSTR